MISGACRVLGVDDTGTIVARAKRCREVLGEGTGGDVAAGAALAGTVAKVAPAEAEYMIQEGGGGPVTAQPQAVKSYQPGDLSARAVKGWYVGTGFIPIVWMAFHVTPVSDDEFEACGCAGRRGTRASRRDPFTRQVPGLVPSR